MAEKFTTNEAGFTLIELLLVISMFVVILALSVPNLFSPLGVEKVNDLSQDIKSILSEAQTKAVSSETLGLLSTSEFGVHFTGSTYTIFRGTIFNPGDPNNFQVNVPSGLTIVPNLPCPVSPNDCNSIVFLRLTGEIQNFDQTKNSLCLADNLNNKIKVFTSTIGVVNAQTDSC